MEYNRGSSGIVFIQTPNIVVKKTKKSNILHEYKVHEICFDICIQNKFQILKVPRIIQKINNKSYSMEKIDDKEMITNPDKSVLKELQTLIRALEKNNIRAFDYELYAQPDGSVYMIDFDKFTCIP